MAKLPSIPDAWNDPSAAAPQDNSPPGSGTDTMSGGILDGWQPAGWSPAGSGLNIVLDPQTLSDIDFGGERFAQATPAAAVNTVPALPAGVDWGFIKDREGVHTHGYVPPDDDNHPDANSGVTIASGFDLGRRTAPDCKGLGFRMIWSPV